MSISKGQIMIQDSLIGLIYLMIYFACAVAIVLPLRKKLGLEGEIMRKILHLVCVSSIFVLLEFCSSWQSAAIVSAVFIIVVYPILKIFERKPLYGSFFCQRCEGEVKNSLITVFIVYIVMIVVLWGILGSDYKFIIGMSVAAWGFGDAAAALVGKNFGQHRFKGKLLPNKKSIEGTLAMYVVAFIAIVVTSMLLAGLSFMEGFIIAVIATPFCTAAELFTPGGYDTVTVPFAAAACIGFTTSFLPSLTVFL